MVKTFYEIIGDKVIFSGDLVGTRIKFASLLRFFFCCSKTDQLKGFHVTLRL
jgi:hypothetical protein